MSLTKNPNFGRPKKGTIKDQEEIQTFWLSSVNANSFIETLTEAVKRLEDTYDLAEEVTVSIDRDYGYDGEMAIFLEYERHETEEEFQVRSKRFDESKLREKEAILINEANEHTLYLKLKEKYGND